MIDLSKINIEKIENRIFIDVLARNKCQKKKNERHFFFSKNT
jgi:hypothetical protein